MAVSNSNCWRDELIRTAFTIIIITIIILRLLGPRPSWQCLQKNCGARVKREVKSIHSHHACSKFSCRTEIPELLFYSLFYQLTSSKRCLSTRGPQIRTIATTNLEACQQPRSHSAVLQLRFFDASKTALP
jgi:hypothetical protein